MLDKNAAVQLVESVRKGIYHSTGIFKVIDFFFFLHNKQLTKQGLTFSLRTGSTLHQNGNLQNSKNAENIFNHNITQYYTLTSLALCHIAQKLKITIKFAQNHTKYILI